MYKDTRVNSRETDKRHNSSKALDIQSLDIKNTQSAYFNSEISKHIVELYVKSDMALKLFFFFLSSCGAGHILKAYMLILGF